MLRVAPRWPEDGEARQHGYPRLFRIDLHSGRRVERSVGITGRAAQAVDMTMARYCIVAAVLGGDWYGAAGRPVGISVSGRPNRWNGCGEEALKSTAKELVGHRTIEYLRNRSCDLKERIMNLSARNQLKGKVVEVHKGTTTAHVRMDLGHGITLTSSITNEAVDELGLKVGDSAAAVIKASDVMIGK
jgi:molybdopterin-binding protein